jgi:hypothetical protein
MSKWVMLGLVSTFLIASSILASQINGALAGQVIAASASISVAAVGFWIYFKKYKD